MQEPEVPREGFVRVAQSGATISTVEPWAVMLCCGCFSGLVSEIPGDLNDYGVVAGGVQGLDARI
jgi:hypothetical protein